MGNTYNDAGATAVDSNGNSLNVSSTGNVNTNIVGTYTITYTATDSEGRVSIATRTVVVIDSTPPVITVTGDNPVTVELGDGYTDAGATASDVYVQQLLLQVVQSIQILLELIPLPIQQLMLQAIPQLQLEQLLLKIQLNPVITITGDNPVSIEQYQTYTDAGATASDASGSATVTSSGTVDTNTVGTYTITYTATDASGNTSTAIRTVTSYSRRHSSSHYYCW